MEGMIIRVLGVVVVIRLVAMEEISRGVTEVMVITEEMEAMLHISVQVRMAMVWLVQVAGLILEYTGWVELLVMRVLRAR